MVNLPFRPPGVYFEPSEARYTPITLRERGIAGFLGLAERGPVHMPIELTSHEGFLDIYGRLDEGTYLEPAVRAFFENGGARCYVVRIAHLDPRKPGETAARSSGRLADAEGRNTVVVHCINEGAWGNGIEVEVLAPRQNTQTFLTLDLKEGDAHISVRSTHGIERGAMLRVFDDDGNEEIFLVQEVSGRTVRFAPGQAAKMTHRSYAPTYVEPVIFGLRIDHLGREEVFEKLSFGPLSPNYFETYLNLRSNLIRVQDLNTATAPPGNLPRPGQVIALSGGQDGLFSVTPEDFIGADRGPGARTGLHAYEILEDVDVLCVPDVMWAIDRSTGFHSLKDVEIVQRAMLSQCEQLKDRFCLLDVPKGHSPQTALQWRQLFDSPYGALYFPWIGLHDGTHTSMVPPSGAVAGVYARCDRSEGVLRAPANEELKGVLDVAVDLNESDVGTLNKHGINCIRPFPARGVRVWGARTCSSDPRQRFIPVRRTLSSIIRSLNLDLQWVPFESNTPTLWKKIARNVGFFLYELWRAGYFVGASPEEAFFVKCDEENNPSSHIDQGMVVVDVGVAPVRPAEFIVFRVQQELETPLGD